jgi:hypothetical protein
VTATGQRQGGRAAIFSSQATVPRLPYVNTNTASALFPLRRRWPPDQVDSTGRSHNRPVGLVLSATRIQGPFRHSGSPSCLPVLFPPYISSRVPLLHEEIRGTGHSGTSARPSGDTAASLASGTACANLEGGQAIGVVVARVEEAAHCGGVGAQRLEVLVDVEEPHPPAVTPPRPGTARLFFNLAPAASSNQSFSTHWIGDGNEGRHSVISFTNLPLCRGTAVGNAGPMAHARTSQATSSRPPES